MVVYDRHGIAPHLGTHSLTNLREPASTNPSNHDERDRCACKQIRIRWIVHLLAITAKIRERTTNVTRWNGARRASLLHPGALGEVAREVSVAGLFVARDRRASTNSGPMWGNIAKPRLICCGERLVRIDNLASITRTRRLSAYSSHLLHNIAPAASLWATGCEPE